MEEAWVGPKRLGWIHCGWELREKRCLLEKLRIRKSSIRRAIENYFTVAQ